MQFRWLKKSTHWLFIHHPIETKIVSVTRCIINAIKRSRRIVRHNQSFVLWFKEWICWGMVRMPSWRFSLLASHNLLEDLKWKNPYFTTSKRPPRKFCTSCQYGRLEKFVLLWGPNPTLSASRKQLHPQKLFKTAGRTILAEARRATTKWILWRQPSPSKNCVLKKLFSSKVVRALITRDCWKLNPLKWHLTTFKLSVVSIVWHDFELRSLRFKKDLRASELD